MGSTRDVSGIYSLVASLQYLVHWVKTSYWPWYKEFLLGALDSWILHERWAHSSLMRDDAYGVWSSGWIGKNTWSGVQWLLRLVGVIRWHINCHLVTLGSMVVETCCHLGRWFVKVVTSRQATLWGNALENSTVLSVHLESQTWREFIVRPYVFDMSLQWRCGDRFYYQPQYQWTFVLLNFVIRNPQSKSLEEESLRHVLR